MPTHTVSSALIKLYYAVPGAPWIYPAWQDITGVRHGLFPAEDDKLPPGWTRKMANAVDSYFDQYSKAKTEDDKIKFAAKKKKKNDTDPVEGRPLYNDWVVSHYSPIWKVHNAITSAFKDCQVHPLQIMASNDDFSTFPGSSSYLPYALDRVALLLLGKEALDKSSRLLLPLREPMLILLQRTWENSRKQTGRNKNALVKLEQKAVAAFEALDRDALTKAKINNVIGALGKWRDLAELYCTTGGLEKVEDMHDELQSLPSGLDQTMKRPWGEGSQKKPATLKISSESLTNALTSAEDVSEVLALYNEHFGIESTDAMPLEGNSIGVAFGVPVEGADPGVAIEFGMSYEELNSNLGFRKGLPFVFNIKRHSSGYTAWNPQHAPLFDPKRNDPLLEDIKLHWHQSAGIHAMIRMIFTSEPSATHCTGVLLADEVGLGKTFQACAVIAFLGELAVRQEQKLNLPPIIVERRYLQDYEQLPSFAHLIIVPGTLLSQWENELKILFKPKMFEILLYGTGAKCHESFWAPDGPYQLSKQRTYSRIILASQSALQQDFGLLYSSQRPGGNALPWDHPEPIVEDDLIRQKTLYGHQYLSVTFDEAQSTRNCGAKHSAALLILEQAIVRLILTATPLQTSTRDLAAMGRLVGIPYFSSPNAYAEQQLDAAELRRAKQERNGDEPDEDNDPYKLCQVNISLRIQKLFNGRVICRTVTSTDPTGKLLIDLPPLTIIYGVIDLTEREMAIRDP